MSLLILGVDNLGIIPNGSRGSYTLSVLHVLGLCCNVILVQELCKLDLSLEFGKDKFLVREKHKKVLVEGAVSTGLYKIPVGPSLLTTTSSLALWHAHFGHVNIDYLCKAAKMVVGLPTVGGHKDLCSSCIKGKQHQEAFPPQSSCRATKVLEVVHMDLCGLMQAISLGGIL